MSAPTIARDLPSKPKKGLPMMLLARWRDQLLAWLEAWDDGLANIYGDD